MIPIDQEPDLVPRNLIRESALVLGIAIAACIGATLLLGGHRLFAHVPVDTAPPARLDTELFQDQTEAERAKVAAAERLKQYGWVDRARGIIHIPIDVAIEQYLARPAR